MIAPQHSALWQHDTQALGSHPGLIGVDEAGRGALAGPVVAAAVYCPATFYHSPRSGAEIATIHDSKQLKAAQRTALAHTLMAWQEQGLLHIAWASASVAEIEQHNILGATRLAMRRALEALRISLRPVDTSDDLPLFQTHPAATPATPHLLVDGKPLRPFPYAHQNLIGGDGRSFCIAAASIIAKVQRDALMLSLDTDHPPYGFARHKGYGTGAHCQAIRQHGPSPAHRPTFLRKLGGSRAKRI